MSDGMNDVEDRSLCRSLTVGRFVKFKVSRQRHRSFPKSRMNHRDFFLPRGNDPTASKAVTSKRGDDAFFFGHRCSLLLDFGLTNHLDCRYALFADTCTKASFPIHSPNARPGGFSFVLGLQQTCSNQSGSSPDRPATTILSAMDIVRFARCRDRAVHPSPYSRSARHAACGKKMRQA
jgi:hypothetical protein